MEKTIEKNLVQFYGKGTKLLDLKHGYCLSSRNTYGFNEYLVHSVKEKETGLFIDQVGCSENRAEMEKLLEVKTKAMAVLKDKDALWLESVIRDGVTFDGKTEEQYRKEGFLIMPFDEAMALINANENKKYITSWEEIAKESYMYSFEALPPARYETHGDAEYFMLGEAYSGNIYSHYVSYKGKYFSAKRRTTEVVSNMIDEVKALVQSN